MSDQPSLFDEPEPAPRRTPRRRAVARRTDPDTSHAAAASVGDLRDSQLAVLDALRNGDGPATDEQIAQRLRERGVRMSPSGARTRRSELVDAGLVHDTGDRKRTESGRSTIVWAVTSAGWLYGR